MERPEQEPVTFFRKAIILTLVMVSLVTVLGPPLPFVFFSAGTCAVAAVYAASRRHPLGSFWVLLPMAFLSIWVAVAGIGMFTDIFEPDVILQEKDAGFPKR